MYKSAISMSPMNGGYDARQGRALSGSTAQEVPDRNGVVTATSYQARLDKEKKEKELLQADLIKARGYYSILHARTASESRLDAIMDLISNLQEKGNLTPQEQLRLASLTEAEKQERSNFKLLNANAFSFWKNNRDIATKVDDIFNKGTGMLDSGDSLRDLVWEQAAAEETGRTPLIRRGTVSEYLDSYVDKHPLWGSFARFVSPVDSLFGVYENAESGHRNKNINTILGEGNVISELAKANSSNHTAGLAGGYLRSGTDAAMTAAGIFGPAKGIGSVANIGTNAARTAATQAGANATKAQVAKLFGKEALKGTGKAFTGYYKSFGGGLTGTIAMGQPLYTWYNSKPEGTTWSLHMWQLPGATWEGAKHLAIIPFDPRFSRRYGYGVPVMVNGIMDNVDKAVGDFYHNNLTSSAFNNYIETAGKINSGIVDQNDLISNNNTNNNNTNNASIFGTLTNSIKNHPYAWGIGAAGALGLGAYMAYRNSLKEEEEKKKKLQLQSLTQYYGLNAFNKTASKTSELQLYLQYKKEIG